jgi:hypothetical protein
MASMVAGRRCRKQYKGGDEMIASRFCVIYLQLPLLVADQEQGLR